MTRPVDVRETHCAVVVMIGDTAYKVKKPVDLGFLDFTTREARLHACRREVELNRRMAPDVYLGVADVRGPDGNWCDHMVVMRRMPDDRRLSRLVADGVDVDDAVRDLAKILAGMHTSAGSGPLIAREGTRDAVRARWQANLREVRALVPAAVAATVVDRIEALAETYLEGRAELFESRVDHGLVRDGHGDLLADDVFCLDDGPRALDCLEFDDRLRWMDVLDDVACLAMDLERLGAPRLAARFVAWYSQFSGWPESLSLEHHYIAYRAFMRAKIAGLRLASGEHAAHRQAAALAAISLSHLNAGKVRLIVVGGLPGTGKSTLAAALADRLGAVLLRSDRVRKERGGLDPAVSASASWRQGIYSEDATHDTYDTLLTRARASLRMGESVILDGSFADTAHRRAVDRLATETSADVVPFMCVAPIDVVHARLAMRAAEDRDVSDADTAIADRMAIAFDAWPEATIVYTEAPSGEALDRVVSHVVPRESPSWHRRPVLLPDEGVDEDADPRPTSPAS